MAWAGYMVMEYMEGETLAARIGKGAIPLDQALTYATQIADALDRAHRAGVTHRDVKPHNIMLTRDGVKVLDVKGGVKLDQWGGEKVDQSTGWMGLSLKDLRGWRERRPANRLAGRV